MDILIKTFVRQCMEAIDPMSRLPMAELVKAFGGYQEDIAHLARAFHAAYTHVHRSTVIALQAII